MTKKEPVMSDLFASAVTGRNETTGQAGSFGMDPRGKRSANRRISSPVITLVISADWPTSYITIPITFSGMSVSGIPIVLATPPGFPLRREIPLPGMRERKDPL